MADINSQIKVKLANTHNIIKFTVITTREHGELVTNEFITLQKGKYYYIPIDSNLSLADFTFFKINPDLIDFIDVRNIVKGTATVIPLVHGIQLVNDTLLGSLI